MTLKIGSMRFFEPPDVERLLGTIEGGQTDLLRRINGAATGSSLEGWAVAAYQHFETARAELVRCKYQVAWREAKAAERSMLEDPKDPDGAIGVATTIFRQSESMLGWRRKAIVDLLCDDKEKLRIDLASHRPLIVQAAILRDDYFDTQYFKIELRGTHLGRVGYILCVALITLICLSYGGYIELFQACPDRLAVVVLFGVLGAALSVAQAMLASDISSGMTSQQLGAFVIWMRPTIGATAAAVAYVLLLANKNFGVFDKDLTANFSVIVVIALLAGFSERFIVGALSRVAASQGGEKAKTA